MPFAKMFYKCFFILNILIGISSSLDTGNCGKPLGMKSNEIADKHITASSYFDDAVNAFYGRAHVEEGGGAWCPQAMIHNKENEYLEIDLRSPHVLTKVEVQGRFGNGQGKEFAESFKLQYWRPGLDRWVTYQDGRGEEVFEGNTNTYLAKSNQLMPPAIVSRVRFVPFSEHPRTVCMRVEIYGCRYLDGLVSYSVRDGDLRGGDNGLTDVTYDGFRRHGFLSGGLGQLVDGENGHNNFLVDSIAKGRGYEWIGWRNESTNAEPVELIFEFDDVRNFSSVQLYTNNIFTRDAMIFSRARISFSVGGDSFTAARPISYSPQPDRIFEYAREVFIDLKGRVGRYVKIQLFFSLKWIMVSEVHFQSVLCNCNATDDEILLQDEDSEVSIIQQLPPSSTSSAVSGLVLGSIVTVGVICAIVVAVAAFYYCRGRFTKCKDASPVLSNTAAESRKVSMKMKDFHINMNLSPSGNGYSRAKGKLYGHVHMEEEVAAMYQEPFKGQRHNPGYYTINRDTRLSEDPLKGLVDQDDSVDYAVPDVNMTPPPPFSEIYTPPPPVPLSRPPVRTRPVPSIPPPPEQQYYVAPHLCQPSEIQGVAGTVYYSVIDSSIGQKEVAVSEIPRQRIHFLDQIGEGMFGTVHLSEIDGLTQSGGSLSSLTITKTLCTAIVLNQNASSLVKEKFKSEARLLSVLNDSNIVKMIGVVTRFEPMAIFLEYLDCGDLHQFLREHTFEDVLLYSTNTNDLSAARRPTLSQGALIHISTQISSGMKYLEKINVVHRDLSTRNCLVGQRLTIKITNFALSRSQYAQDYYNVEDCVKLPIRWMAWESVLHGRFTVKSDVWAFGVTFWEVLTMARRRPYDDLTDEGVLENLSHFYHNDEDGMIFLSQPPCCSREIYDMMKACWTSLERQRPPFWEIHMFLQRKNIGYALDYKYDLESLLTN